MKTHFEDIFYPTAEEELNKLCNLDDSDGSYKAIILPHASLENVNYLYNEGFSKLKKVKRYVFIAPMHNGKYPLSSTSLFTLSSSIDDNVKITSAANITIDDSILEEEYSFELVLLYLKRLKRECEIIPIFTALEVSDEIKKLKKVISSFSDDDTSFIISSNFSLSSSNDKAIMCAKNLINALKDNTPLLEEEKKGNISSCGIKIFEAFRNKYKNFDVLAIQDKDQIVKEIDDCKGNVIHLLGAYYD